MYNLLLNGLGGPGVNLTNSRVEPDAALQRRSRNKEVGRLLSAALVSPHFQHMVLQQPERALAEGYLGQHFDLDAGDSAIVCSGRASTLQELAIALVDQSLSQRQEQPRRGKLRESSSQHVNLVTELNS